MQSFWEDAIAPPSFGTQKVFARLTPPRHFDAAGHCIVVVVVTGPEVKWVPEMLLHLEKIMFQERANGLFQNAGRGGESSDYAEIPPLSGSRQSTPDENSS